MKMDRMDSEDIPLAAPMAPAPECYRLGDLVVDACSGQVLRGSEEIALPRLSWDLLLALVRAAPAILSIDELMDRVWPGLVVGPETVSQRVKLLRDALGDDAQHPRYIAGVRGRGYRLAVPAHPMSERRGVGTARPGEAAGWRRPVLLAGLLLAALALWLLVLRFDHGEAIPRATASERAIAVLPFADMSAAGDQEYFADGLSEEIINELAQIRELKVISRTSSFSFKGKGTRILEIGRVLGVNYILEGSVRKAGDWVRITAQLVKSGDGSHVWSETYDRQLTDVLSVQTEIAEKVAGALDLTTAERGHGRHAPSGTTDSVAYELYLKGRYFWSKRTAQGFQQAIAYFEQAIAQDPFFARAHAGLADSYALMHSYYFAPAHDVIPKAQAAARRALEIDDTIAEAHTSLALIAQNHDWDWRTAEREYRRAIHLNPNYATAHHWYAEYLAFQGRFEEALAEIENARQLDPLSLIIAADKGAIFYFSRQYDSAIAQLRSVLEMEANFPRARLLAFVYAGKGMYAEAIANVQEWQRIEDDPWSWVTLAYIYGRWGREQEARLARESLQRSSGTRPLDPISFFIAHVGKDDKEEAFAFLQQVWTERSSALVRLKVDPIYDPVRSDPRFQALLRRMNFP